MLFLLLPRSPSHSFHSSCSITLLHALRQLTFVFGDSLFKAGCLSTSYDFPSSHVRCYRFTPIDFLPPLPLVSDASSTWTLLCCCSLYSFSSSTLTRCTMRSRHPLFVSTTIFGFGTDEMGVLLRLVAPLCLLPGGVCCKDSLEVVQSYDQHAPHTHW